MPNRTGNGKITSYRNYSWLNIGTIMFGAIFLYMVISLVVYLTARHVTSYEVTAGSISGNYRYTALALKNEEIIKADYSGYVTWYAREGARAGSGMTVLTIDEYQSSPSDALTEINLTDADYRDIRTAASSFALHYSGSTFQDVYDFKADLESYLLQLSTTQDDPTGSLRTSMNAPSSGFVVYKTDGMEGLTDDDISSALFNRNNYESVNLRLNNQVKAGDDIYKLISGEDWSLYIPLTSALATQLHDRETIRFRFLKDDTTFSAAFSVLENNGEYFGKISLRNSLVRYVTDRYLEIELLMDRRTGLKIPASAIVERVFYKIPQEYVIENSDSRKEITILRERFSDDGSSNVDYVTATVYDSLSDGYLVATSLFSPGDYVRMTDTNKKHQIVEDDLVTIQGVYNINRGYAIFRQVTVVDENEEFCIIEPDNPYGLAAHDYIALDADTVDADEIV